MALIDGVPPVDRLPKVWDPESRIGDMLRGKRGLVVGIANEHSIAFGCAAKLRGFGAELASGMTGDTIYVDTGLHVVT